MNLLGPDGNPIHVDRKAEKKVERVLAQSLKELDELVKDGPPKSPQEQAVGSDDKPCSVTLEEYVEGVDIPDPGDPIKWAIGGSQLTYRFLQKLYKHRADAKRTDLVYTIRWSVNMDGNRLFIKATIGLP